MNSSAVGAFGILPQLELVEALAGSNDLHAFIPSDFGTPWSDEELAQPQLAFLAGKEVVLRKTEELKVPTAVIKTGGFPEVFFAYP